jgi:hypothetical protein
MLLNHLVQGQTGLVSVFHIINIFMGINNTTTSKVVQLKAIKERLLCPCAGVHFKHMFFSAHTHTP